MARAPRATNRIAVGAAQTPAQRPRRRRWLGVGILGTLAVLVGGAYLAAGSQPALRFALAQAEAGGYDIQAKSLSGNLLGGVTATDATVKSELVNGSVKSVRVRYDLWTLLTRREVKLDVSVTGGKLNFDPGKLIAPANGTPPAPLPVTIRLESVRVADTTVKLFNKAFFSPDVKITVLEQKPLPGKSGSGKTLRGDLKLALTASGGTGTAAVRYDIGENFATNLNINADLDARIARYWYEPILGGRITGSVQVTPKFVTAQARLDGGRLEPLKGLVVSGVSGRVNLTADTKVSALLTGQALDGDLEADIGVDISRERWSVLGKLSPSVSSALKLFAPGVAGTGRLAVTLRGDGWQTLNLSGTATGSANTSVTGFPLKNLKTDWRFSDHLELSGTAASKLGSDTIPLTASVKTQGERVLVAATAGGEFLKSPLSANARIDVYRGLTRLELTGRALRGSVTASGSIKGDRLDATGNFAELRIPVPLESRISGTARATGRLSDLNISGQLSPASFVVPGVKTRDVAGPYALNWNGKSLSGNANLARGQLVWRGAIVNTGGAPASGELTVAGLPLEPAGRVSAALTYRLNPNGSGAIEGQTKGYDLNLQGVNLEAAQGNLDLAWNGSKLNGHWNTDRFLAGFDERQVRLQPRGWEVSYGGQRLALNGDASLTYAGLKISGALQGSGALGEISATGEGDALRLAGTVRYQALELGLNGTLALQPLNLQLNLQPRSSVAKVGGEIRLGFTKTLSAGGFITSGVNQRLNVTVNGSQIRARGGVDLSLVDLALPLDSRGLVRGTAQVQSDGGLTTARVTATVSGVPLTAQVAFNGNRATSSATVTGGDFAGAQLNGQVFPNLNARVQYQGVTARVTGEYSDLRFTARGAIPKLAALQTAGVQFRNQRFTAAGRFVSGALEVTGQVGGLRVSNGVYQNGNFSARLNGDLAATYQGEPIQASGIDGKFSYSGGSLRVDTTAGSVQGSLAGARLRLERVTLGVTQASGRLTARLSSEGGAGVYRGEQVQLSASSANASLVGDQLSSGFRTGFQGAPQGESVAGQVAGTIELNLRNPNQNWIGQLNASAAGQGWKLNAVGPWSRIALDATAPASTLARVARVTLPEQFRTTLRAQGFVSLPDAKYTANLSGALGKNEERLLLDGKIAGQGATWNANAVATDANGHEATLRYDSSGVGNVRAQNLKLTAVTIASSQVSGMLSLRGARITGEASGTVSNLPFSARWLASGAFRGEVTAGLTVGLASPRWDFPLGVAPISLTSKDSSLPVSATGTLYLTNGVRAQGQINLKTYRLNVPGGTLSVPAQAFPFDLSATNGLKLRVLSQVSSQGTGTSATFDGKRWAGGLKLRYRAWDEDGQLNAAVTGVLADPRLSLETSGQLNLQGEASLTDTNLRGSVALEPLTRALDQNLTSKLEAGRLQFFARLNPTKLTGSVNATLLNSSVDGEAASLQLSASLGDGLAGNSFVGNGFAATGALALGRSRTEFRADRNGISASQINLDLRLLRLFGITASGTAVGSLELPEYDLKRGAGSLRLSGLRAFDASADGNLTLRNGQISSDLRGVAPGKLSFAVSGDLYPSADAALQLEGLRGRFTGSKLETRQRSASLVLDGEFYGKTSRVAASLNGSRLDLNVAWDAVTIGAGGSASESGVKLTGRLNAASLRGVAGVDGNLSAALSVNGATAKLEGLQGTAAGFAVRGGASFEGGALRLSNFSASNRDFSLTGSGQVLPSLELKADLESRNPFAPGTATATASGSIQTPLVKLEGTLTEAKQGLIVPGTALAATFDGTRWALNLKGERLNGKVLGDLRQISVVGLNLNAPVIYNDTRLNVSGNPAWTRDTGFGGVLNASGDLSGSAAKLLLRGQRDLAARLEWRGGAIRAKLPGSLSGSLKGDLNLEQFDLGALWGKPGRLTLQGAGAVTGTWSQPVANFTGALAGKETSLNSRLELSYADAGLNATLRGERLEVVAALDAKGYTASGRFEAVALESLLPVEVKALNASGSFKAAGLMNGALPDVELNSLNLSGDANPVGAFTAQGAARLTAGQLSTDLHVRALSGTIDAVGKLGARDTNLELTLAGVSLERLGVAGLANGRVKLGGAIRDPTASGEVRLTDLKLPGQDWGATANLSVADRLLNPSLAGTVALNGSATGRLQVSLRNPLSQTPRVSLRGNAKLPLGSLSGSLEGTFPALSGRLEAQINSLPGALQKIALQGDGSGGYTLQNAGLSGDLTLTGGATLLDAGITGRFKTDLELAGLKLLEELGGRVTGELVASGTIAKPTANFQGNVKSGKVSSLTLPDLTFAASYDAGKLAASGSYTGGKLSWDGAKLSVTNLPVDASGFKLLLNASGKTAPPDLTYNAKLSGNAGGNLSGRYANETLDLQLEAGVAGYSLNGSAQGSPKLGWTGGFRLNGLPASSPFGTADPTPGAGGADLRLGGAFNAPSLTGTAQTLNARLELSASLSPLQARIQGAGNASGAVTYKNNKLEGTITYKDAGLTLNVSPSGSLERPAATASASYGKASAGANLSLESGKPQGTLTLSDGLRNGSFALRNETVSGELPGFDLSSLGQAGFGGTVSLRANLTMDNKATLGWRGQASTVWNNVTTPLEIPALGWKVDGTGRASLNTETGVLALNYAGTPGTAGAELRLQNKLWQGSINLDLRGARGAGGVKGQIRLTETGLQGEATAQSLALELLGVPVTVTGDVKLNQDSFTASGEAAALGGKVTVSGSGGLSDLIPMLEAYTKTAPGDLGYTLRARLDTVKLEDVALIHERLPYATGRAVGVVQVTDGISNFQISVPELTLPNLSTDSSQRVRLGLRVSGTSAGNSLRYSGQLVGLTGEPGVTKSFQSNFDGYGESQFNGSFDGKSASGLLEMRRVPLHSLIGGVIGALPGSVTATGLARYNFNLAEIAKSELRVALEKLEVEGGGDKLSGAGALNFKNGNFTLDQLDLRGRGRWTGSGRYTRDRVDLNLDFENTSFTPVLALIPNLREYNPDASGTLRLKLSGQYDNPNATLEVQNLRGSISNIALTAQRLDGSLQNGDFKLTGTVASDETLGAVLQTTATAKVKSLSPLNISGLEAKASGSLNVRPVGLIQNVNARIYGASGGFKLEATGQKGGPLSINGDISPVLNLRLTGRNLIVPIPDFFVSDSLLDADIGFRGDGGRSYLVSGQVNIARLTAALNQGQRAATPGAPPATPPVSSVAAAPARRNPFLEQIKLGGIRVNAPQGLRINESFASLEAGGTLTLNGTAASPEITGTVDALGSSSGKGTIRLGSNSYTVQSAVAAFSAVDGLYPVVTVDSKGRIRTQLRKTDGNGTLETKEIDVNLRLTVRWVSDGTPGGGRKLVIEPFLTYTSPSGYEQLSQSELYSLVTLGNTSGLTVSGIGQQALDTAFSLFFLSEFSRQFKDATGIDLTVSTNLFNYIFNGSDLSAGELNQLSFRFSLGFDLSKAVRLDFQVDTLGTGAINLNYQSDDGRFGIRFSTPFDLNATNNANDLSVGLKPEFSFSYNISSLNAFSLGLQYLGSNNFSFKFGFSFRF